MKAVIPAAGLGTRMLPLTKAQPKEMLPILDKPAIQYVVEEAVASGITDILIITGKGKRAIEDYFTSNRELEALLTSRGKGESLKKLRESEVRADIFYVQQKSPLGLGDAILFAEKHIGKEPFVLLLGDDIIYNNVPASRQLINVYNTHKAPIIGVEKLPDYMLPRYGVIAPDKKIGKRLFSILDLIEKPKIEEAPSNYAVIGRYLLTPEIFEYLHEIKADRDGELQLTEALRQYNRKSGMLALELEGIRVDTGSIEGWLSANIYAAKLYYPQLFQLLKSDFADK